MSATSAHAPTTSRTMSTVLRSASAAPTPTATMSAAHTASRGSEAANAAGGSCGDQTSCPTDQTWRADGAGPHDAARSERMSARSSRAWRPKTSTLSNTRSVESSCAVCL
jgi:hypothetical protein